MVEEDTSFVLSSTLLLSSPSSVSSLSPFPLCRNLCRRCYGEDYDEEWGVRSGHSRGQRSIPRGSSSVPDARSGRRCLRRWTGWVGTLVSRRGRSGPCRPSTGASTRRLGVASRTATTATPPSTGIGGSTERGPRTTGRGCPRQVPRVPCHSSAGQEVCSCLIRTVPGVGRVV